MSHDTNEAGDRPVGDRSRDRCWCPLRLRRSGCRSSSQRIVSLGARGSRLAGASERLAFLATSRSSRSTAHLAKGRPRPPPSAVHPGRAVDPGGENVRQNENEIANFCHFKPQKPAISKCPHPPNTRPTIDGLCGYSVVWIVEQARVKIFIFSHLAAEVFDIHTQNWKTLKNKPKSFLDKTANRPKNASCD